MSDLDIWGDPKSPDMIHEILRIDEGPDRDCDDEGEEIDHDAPSSDFSNGQELDWAHGYGRGQ